MDKTNQVDEFFKDLPDEDKQVADIFDEKKELKTADDSKIPDVKDADTENVPESMKNRRHRRLEMNLEVERDARIRAEERLKAMSEMEKFAKETGDIIIPDIAKMFDSSEVGKENALRLSKVILETREKAKEEVLREIETRREREIEEQKKYEDIIDTQLENLEDEHNVDLTSDAPKARKARREFLELVQDLSPKDEQGNIVGYADFDKAFEMYQKTSKEVTDDKSNVRREEIAGRSMQRSNANTETVKQRSHGFDGWKRDFGINS